MQRSYGNCFALATAAMVGLFSVSIAMADTGGAAISETDLGKSFRELVGSVRDARDLTLEIERETRARRDKTLRDVAEIESAALTKADDGPGKPPPTVEDGKRTFHEALAVFFAEEAFSKDSSEATVREITRRIKERIFDLSKETIGISFQRLHQVVEAAGRRHRTAPELREYFLGKDGTDGLVAGLKATISQPGLKWGDFRPPKGKIYVFLQSELEKLPSQPVDPIPAKPSLEQLQAQATRLKAYLESLEFTDPEGVKKRFKIRGVIVTKDPRHPEKPAFQVEFLDREDFDVITFLGGLRFALGRETGGLFESFGRQNVKSMGVAVYFLTEPPPDPKLEEALRPFLKKHGVDVRGLSLLTDAPSGTATGGPGNRNVVRIEISKPTGISDEFAKIDGALREAQGDLPWMTKRQRRGEGRVAVVSTWEIVTVAADGTRETYRNKNPFTGLPLPAAKRDDVLAKLKGSTLAAYDKAETVHGLSVQKVSGVKVEDMPAKLAAGWTLRQRLGRGKQTLAHDLYLSAPR